MSAAANGAASTSTANGTASAAPAGSVSADWAEILDYTTTIWAQRLAETVSEAARWRAVAAATQRSLEELAARVTTLEGEHAAAAEQ